MEKKYESSADQIKRLERMAQDRLKEKLQAFEEAEADYLSEKLSQSGVVWYLEGFQDSLSFKLYGEVIAVSRLVNGVPVLNMPSDIAENIKIEDFRKDAIRLTYLLLKG